MTALLYLWLNVTLYYKVNCCKCSKFLMLTWAASNVLCFLRVWCKIMAQVGNHLLKDFVWFGPLKPAASRNPLQRAPTLLGQTRYLLFRKSLWVVPAWPQVAQVAGSPQPLQRALAASTRPVLGGWPGAGSPEQGSPPCPRVPAVAAASASVRLSVRLSSAGRLAGVQSVW